MGADESRLERTIVRINTIESTSPLANLDSVDSASLPAVLVPSEPPSPDRVYEQAETRDRMRRAMALLPHLLLQHHIFQALGQMAQQLGQGQAALMVVAVLGVAAPGQADAWPLAGAQPGLPMRLAVRVGAQIGFCMQIRSYNFV